MILHGTLISRLSDTVAHSPPQRPLTWRLCHGVQALLAADGVSITLENTTPGHVTLCVTDRRSELLEDLQDVLGEGPCLSAFTTGRPATAPLGTAAATASWPEFAEEAAKIIGPHGVLWSLPIRPATLTLGTLSLYRLSPGPLAEPLAAAQSLADATGTMLLDDPQAFLESPRGGGWCSRAVVHQATGMLIAQIGVDADAALALLRAHAFASGEELIRVARDVVDRKLDLSLHNAPA